MVHSGCSYRQLHNVMSAMEIPAISFNSLKSREKEIGCHIGKVAKQSCQDALQLEIESLRIKSPSCSESQISPAKSDEGTVDSGSSCTVSPSCSESQISPAKSDEGTVDSGSSCTVSPSCSESQKSPALSYEGTVDSGPSCTVSPPGNETLATPSCTVKYDMGWQKRGSGRCYDSLSGVGTMIGNETGKIVAFGVRSKDCRKCAYYAAKSKKPPQHDCSKNWSGSSKAMEPDVGACLVKELELQNVTVGTLIMDDDCTTMARIKTVAKTPVTKWSDINHTKKHIGNALYKLQSTHRALTVKVIQWLQKCFSYAVAQHKNDANGLAATLLQIVPHAYGEHDKCDTSWCMYKKDPENYRHASLPHGKDLSGEALRTDLNKTFQHCVLNVEKIAPGGSTREVESFNGMVAAKAPKRCHYSSSSSLVHRVQCAVAQKNIGYGYVNEINESVGVSPGMIYKRVSQKLNRLKRKRLEYENTITFKKRKFQRKLVRKTSLQQKELREGVTYKSAVATTSMSDVTEIPAAVVSPGFKHIENMSGCTKIYCDIETTSLHKTCDLTQIAAISNGDSFNKYIFPGKAISPSASQVTGLCVMDNVMYYHGSPVEASSLQESLSSLLSWLDDRKPCILVGHNSARFDFPRLIRALYSCKLLNAFLEAVVGIVDTLPLLKMVYPDLNSYSQQNIVSFVLNESYAAHNALADVESLEKVVNSSTISDKLFEQCSSTSKSSVECYHHDIMTDQHLACFDLMKAEKILSCQMAKKIASSGLNASHLRLAVSRGGLEGLSELFREKLETGKPRVTSVKKIIDSVHNYLRKSI